MVNAVLYLHTFMMMHSTLHWLMFLLQRCLQRRIASRLDRCCWQATGEASNGLSSPSEVTWARRRRGSVTVITAGCSSVGARPRTIVSPSSDCVPKYPNAAVRTFRFQMPLHILLLSHNALRFKSLPSTEVVWVTLHCS